MPATSGCSASAPPVAPPPRIEIEHAFRHAGFVDDLGERVRRVAGVSEAGFMTTVLPKASAGALFHAGMAIGKFHGVISPNTPSGSRYVSTVDAGPRRIDRDAVAAQRFAREELEDARRRA